MCLLRNCNKPAGVHKPRRNNTTMFKTVIRFVAVCDKCKIQLQHAPLAVNRDEASMYAMQRGWVEKQERQICSICRLPVIGERYKVLLQNGQWHPAKCVRHLDKDRGGLWFFLQDTGQFVHFEKVLDFIEQKQHKHE